MTLDLNIQKISKSSEDMSSLASQSKKQLEDNPLLEALTLVIESNAEYARGVTTILDSDLERELLLNEIKKEILTTKKIMDKHTATIEHISSQVNTIKTKLDILDNTISDALQEKLGPLYIAANLQESGEQYNPMDKLVVYFQKAVSSKLFVMSAGIVIWYVAKFIFKGIGN